jgi:DNA-binding CsgD family transcriptional regulator/tetratricopeptide (TPR) repeat protein
VVQGEAGIGKSRLVAECVLDLLGPSEVLLVGNCVDLLSGELPYGLFTSALRDLVQRIGLDEVRQAAGETAPALGALVPGLSSGARHPPDRTRTFDALVTLLTRLCTDRLVCLVAEDLQWVDNSSRDLLGFLIRAMNEPSRLLVMATVRTDATPLAPAVATLLDELVRSRTAEQISLGRLSEEHVAEQVRALLPRQRPAQEVLDRVVELSDGVPFITEELVAAGLNAEGPLPSSVRALMLHRLTGLAPSTQHVVRTASLGVGHLRHRLLAPVCGLNEADAVTALTEAVRSNVLVVTDAGEGYRFRHALLREAVADSMLPGDRMLAHRRWAEQLERDAVPSDGWEASLAAAHHWWQTDDWQRALDSSLVAASHAYDVAASSEQATLLSRVLELWERVPDAAWRANRDRDQIFEEAVEAMAWAGEESRALSLVEQELRVAERPGYDPIRLLYLRILQCDFARAIDPDWEPHPPIDVQAAMRVLSEAPGSRSFVRAVDGLVWGFFPTADPRTERRLVERAVEVADQIGTPWDRLWARASSLVHLSQLGHEEEAATGELELVHLVRQECKAVEISVIESNCTYSLCLLGRFQEAAEMGRQALRRLRDPHLARWAWVHATENLCTALFELGEWDEAEDILQTSRELDVLGEGATELEIVDGLIRCYRGDPEAADACLQSALTKQASHSSTEHFIAPLVLWLSAEVAMACGDVASAEDRLAPLWRNGRPEEGHGGMWRPLLVAARLEADRGAPGHRRRRLAEDTHHRLDAIRGVSQALRPLGPCGAAWRAQLAAELSRAEGRTDMSLWQGAVDAWSATGQVHDRAWATVHLAECQVAIGDKHGAAESLRSARGVGARLRAPPLLHAVADVVHRARLDLDPGGASAPAHPATYGLTDREVEVLRLVGFGRTNEQIAHELFISPKTASAHVSHILSKLNVSSRSQATTAGHRLGLLS